MLLTMYKLLLLAILVHLYTFSLVSGQNNSSTNTDCSDALKRFTERVLIVSTRYLRGYINSNKGETGAVSPMASMLNLAGLALVAEGVTKKETYTTLNLNSPEEITCVANIINYEVLNVPECIDFRGTTNFFANNQYQFTSKFKRIMNEIIVGKAINVDFTDPVSSSNAINSQVASQTGNKIPNIIRDGSIFNMSTEIVSITGAFSTGTWEIEMQSTDQVTEFKVSPSKSVPQTFLYQDAVYLLGYSKILEAQVIQINFCCEAFYLWEILPDRPFTENDLIEKMAQNVNWYYELLENMKPTRVELYVPRYNRSTTVDSNPLFQQATGLQTIFDTKTINLKGAIEGDCPAAVTGGVQSVYLVTGFEGGPVPKEPQSQEPKKTIKIDYPHVWMILRNGRVHFIGVTA